MFPHRLTDTRAFDVAQAMLDGFNRQVVFYDCDEIEYLNDCNFRRLPAARTEEEELSGEVGYPVHEGDVFPETFAPFLLGNPAVREVFMKHHAGLLDAGFWQGYKQCMRAGHVHDVFPCEPHKRFAHLRPARVTVPLRLVAGR